jgi:hypothetical protein
VRIMHVVHGRQDFGVIHLLLSWRSAIWP